MKTNNRSIKFIILSSTIFIFCLLVGSVFGLSYAIYSDNMKKSSDHLIRETSQQIIYNYENYIASILQDANRIIVDLNEDALTGSTDQTPSYFASIVRIKPEIKNIHLYDLYGNLVASDAEVQQTNQSTSVWFQNAVQDQTTHFFTSLVGEDQTYRIIFSRVIQYQPTLQKALLKMEIDFQSILEVNYKTNVGEGGHITILDNDYHIVYTSSLATVGEAVPVFKELTIGMKRVVILDHSYTISLETIANTTWRVAVVYNTDMVQRSIVNFLILLSTVIFIVFILGLFLIVMISNYIAYPITRLEKTMMRIDSRTRPFLASDIRFGAKEVLSLSKSYNAMLVEMEKLMENVIEEQNNQRKSELKALQNQINPHFLYNTLDSIVWLVDNDRKEDAHKMVISLAKLFRISISKGKNIISVKKEIEHVENYLVIQSLRYTDSFSYSIAIDEACYHYEVMKLILQPLVENCIYHGLKNKIDPGHIWITGKMEKRNLVLTVSDDGYGMRKERIAELYERFENPNLSDGVGLKNVYQRLHLYYGEKAYLRIESEIDEGTKIILSIPVEEMKNETEN